MQILLLCAVLLASPEPDAWPTPPAGSISVYDGCNTCTTSADGAIMSCTAMYCGPSRINLALPMVPPGPSEIKLALPVTLREQADTQRVMCLYVDGGATFPAYSCPAGAVQACWDPAKRVFHDCRKVEPDGTRANRVAWYGIRAGLGRGADIMATAIAVEAGAVEANPIQQSVERRVAVSMITISAQVAGCMGVEKFLGAKWAVRLSRVLMIGQFGIAGWNLTQARKAQGR